MQSNLSFKNFAVTKFTFEKVILEKEKAIFQINPQAAISRKEKQFHINMDLEIIDPENSFRLNMLSVGVFEYDTEDEQMILNFMALNGPAIVFPYVRSFIASYTALTGFDTITLPTLNFTSQKETIIQNLIDVDVISNE